MWFNAVRQMRIWPPKLCDKASLILIHVKVSPKEHCNFLFDLSPKFMGMTSCQCHDADLMKTNAQINSYGASLEHLVWLVGNHALRHDKSHFIVQNKLFHSNRWKPCSNCFKDLYGLNFRLKIFLSAVGVGMS